jgi:hypothetical protein
MADALAVACERAACYWWTSAPIVARDWPWVVSGRTCQPRIAVCVIVCVWTTVESILADADALCKSPARRWRVGTVCMVGRFVPVGDRCRSGYGCHRDGKSFIGGTLGLLMQGVGRQPEYGPDRWFLVVSLETPISVLTIEIMHRAQTYRCSAARSG